VRLKNSGIHSRINGNLEIKFTDEKLTSFSGLELFNRYFRAIKLKEIITGFFKNTGIGGDYKVSELVLTFMSLWLTGGNRLRHIRYLSGDFLIKRICGVKKLATERTLSRWLKRFTPKTIAALNALNSFLVLKSLMVLELARVTLNFDGTVISTGDDVENAARGYNPHKRFSKSYYPFLCHITQTGHFFQVKNRRGNTHDSKGGALNMIADSIRQVRESLGKKLVIEIRLDSAFFSEKILRFLIKSKVLFAVKMPLWKWTGAKELINNRQRWEKASNDLSYFETAIALKKWKITVPVVIYRKCLTKNNSKPKNFQLDLFDPGDGIYEYQVVATNQKLEAKNALDFYNGRCVMEREIAELKQEYGFANIPTKNFNANSAYQAISILAHTLVKNFQMTTDQVTKRKKTAGRTGMFSFESLKSLRFKIIARAGRVVNQSGKTVLKLVDEPAVRKEFEKISAELDQLIA